MVAFSVGAMPEVIEEGVTGYLVADAEEMAAVSVQPPSSTGALRRSGPRPILVRRMVHEHVGLYAAACDVDTQCPAAPYRGGAADS